MENYSNTPSSEWVPLGGTKSNTNGKTTFAFN